MYCDLWKRESGTEAGGRIDSARASFHFSEFRFAWPSGMALGHMAPRRRSCPGEALAETYRERQSRVLWRNRTHAERKVIGSFGVPSPTRSKARCALASLNGSCSICLSRILWSPGEFYVSSIYTSATLLGPWFLYPKLLVNIFQEWSLSLTALLSFFFHRQLFLATIAQNVLTVYQ